MAADPTARATFAQNCVDLIKEYDFDGIDIGKITHAISLYCGRTLSLTLLWSSSIYLDWEYPGFEAHSGTPQDRENFKLLLNDVRARLDELGAETGRFYGLTAGESFQDVCAHLMHIYFVYIGILHILTYTRISP